MEPHVQAADGPRGSVVDLAAEAEVGGVAARLLDDLAADDEHGARAAAGVIDTHPRPGLENAHHEPDDIAGCVGLATLFARRLPARQRPKGIFPACGRRCLFLLGRSSASGAMMMEGGAGGEPVLSGVHPRGAKAYKVGRAMQSGSEFSIPLQPLFRLLC